MVLSVQFTKAVESKQVAQQDAERARFVVLKADQVRKFTACLLSGFYSPAGPPQRPVPEIRRSSLMSFSLEVLELSSYLFLVSVWNND